MKRSANVVWRLRRFGDQTSSDAMSSFWDDSDSDSSSDDEGPTLRQRRDKWRRLADNIRAEARIRVAIADQWQRGCGVPAGPRGRKKRAREVPGTRDRRFCNDFSWRDERARRFDHTKSPWWGLIRHPDVYDERSAAGRRPWYVDSPCCTVDGRRMKRTSGFALWDGGDHRRRSSC